MNKLFALMLLAFPIINFGQTYQFEPHWNVGDTKHITISTHELDYEEGVVISDTTKFNDAQITVVQVDEEHYQLEILFENQALQSAIEYYERLDEELPNLMNLKLIYSVNKKTGVTELQNWEESSDFMTNSIDQLQSLFEKKDPDMAALMSLLFIPLENAFSSKENIENYMEPHISYLVMPFSRAFVLGEKIEVVEIGENPFNPSSELSTKTTTSVQLASIDESSKTCIIEENTEFDMSEMMGMIFAFVEKMVESMGEEEGFTDEKKKELLDFEMRLIISDVITFNYDTTWVTQKVSTASTSGIDPKTLKKNKKEVIVTTTLH